MRWPLRKAGDKGASGRRRATARKAAVLAVAMSVSGAGCGYRVVGRDTTLPKSWKTISVPLFVNRTLQYRLEQRFTQAVVRELEERTSYRIVPDPKLADAVLHGEMTSIETVPVLFDPTTGRATTMLVTVQARVSLEDRASGKTVYKNENFVLRDEYELSTDPKSFFDEESPALERMSREFAARLVADVLENF